MFKKVTDWFSLLRHLRRSSISLAWYKVTESIMNFATDVQRDGKARLCKLAVIDMSKEKFIGDFDMVSIWAGVGEANPIERSRHIKAQSEELKRLLRMCITKEDVRADTELTMNIHIVLDTFE